MSIVKHCEIVENKTWWIDPGKFIQIPPPTFIDPTESDFVAFEVEYGGNSGKDLRYSNIVVNDDKIINIGAIPYESSTMPSFYRDRYAMGIKFKSFLDIELGNDNILKKDTVVHAVLVNEDNNNPGATWVVLKKFNSVDIKQVKNIEPDRVWSVITIVILFFIIIFLALYLN